MLGIPFNINTGIAHKSVRFVTVVKEGANNTYQVSSLNIENAQFDTYASAVKHLTRTCACGKFAVGVLFLRWEGVDEFHFTYRAQPRHDLTPFKELPAKDKKLIQAYMDVCLHTKMQKKQFELVIEGDEEDES